MSGIDDLIHKEREKWINNPLSKEEHLHTIIFPGSESASKKVANEIATRIKEKQKLNEYFVLGLATGSSPRALYSELIKLHRDKGLSFKNVITFNLDEYYPIEPRALQSYVRFMNEHLFDHIDIDPANVHIPDGTLDKSQTDEYCDQYEKKIEAAGGLDFQILGIGRTGHIGFNEPGSFIHSRTRLITLDHITRLDAASDFFGENNVPRKAITMGIGTIMKAKRIVLLAWGEGKAHIIKKTVEGVETDQVPATFLQQHSNTSFYIDEAAAAELSRVKHPWLYSETEWDERSSKKAVIWLSEYLDKPILKLTDRDYIDHGMGELVTIYRSAYNLNIKIFNILQHTITGWPGGKPNADDTNRPERAVPAKKRVVIFSPHPDDDVISMGGTFIRLVDQGHDVHVAYQTSGNIAVFDDDVIRFIDFYKDFQKLQEEEPNKAVSLFKKIQEDIYSKKPGAIDTPEVLAIKSLIRKGEAKAGCRFAGISDEKSHFLNMPFYETGLVKKKPISREDIGIVSTLLNKIKPHQIYAAGDLSDPHGTHRVCLDAILSSLENLKKEKWIKDCWVWLYRGAWQEWPIEEIDMAVPLSPEELIRKRKAIFKHQSQKDSALFPGNDSREFWQRAEDRNRAMAGDYDGLGLAEYEAMEGFKRYQFI